MDVARHVLDDTPHTMLVGEGAREFAIRSGFVEEDLRTQWALEKYHKHNLKSLDEGNRPKDTLSLVCWSHPGYCMAGECSNGHSGSGKALTSDKLAQAAVRQERFVVAWAMHRSLAAASTRMTREELVRANPRDKRAHCCSWQALLSNSYMMCSVGTGDGDIAMLFCPSFSVVRHMKEKRKPSDSCEAVLREIAARWRSLPSNRDMRKPFLHYLSNFVTNISISAAMFELSLIAVSGDGSVGAATTISSWTDLEGNKYAGFPYVVCSQATSYETKTYVSASCLL